MQFRNDAGYWKELFLFFFDVFATPMSDGFSVRRGSALRSSLLVSWCSTSWRRVMDKICFEVVNQGEICFQFEELRVLDRTLNAIVLCEEGQVGLLYLFMGFDVFKIVFWRLTQKIVD